jgi:periplasmic protein TonB
MTMAAPLPSPVNRERLCSATAVAAFHALLGYVLITGLGVSIVEGADDTLKSFAIVDAPTPPQPEPKATTAQKKRPVPEAEAPEAPRNMKAIPTPLVVPQPLLPLPLPAVVAPVPGEGSQANAGASSMPGSGAGAGSQGTGSGTGGSGTGSDGVAIQAERIKGRIRGSDYPESAYRRHASGTVFLRLTVGADGRVSQCAVDESSGHADLDAATCALILKRYRYRPARDAQGRPVPDTVHLAQVWETSERR